MTVCPDDARVCDGPAATGTGVPLVTLFTIPKPFDEEGTRWRQINAIRSWHHLRPAVEVIVCGDEPGTADFCNAEGIRHLPAIRRNQFGTPLVGDACRQIAALSRAPLMAWCNADVILGSDFPGAAARIVAEGRWPAFLAFGRRHEIELDGELDFGPDGSRDEAFARLAGEGRAGPRVCKEYFLATRDVFDSVPDFAVGRGNWDNWMVAAARRRGLPVIDLSPSVMALHQQHGYAHTGRSRLDCYVTGDEARENQRLAGGRHVIRGSCATWRLHRDGLRPVRWAWLNGAFWRDLPAFVRMVGRMPFTR